MGRAQKNERVFFKREGRIPFGSFVSGFFFSSDEAFIRVISAYCRGDYVLIRVSWINRAARTVERRYRRQILRLGVEVVPQTGGVRSFVTGLKYIGNK